MTKEAQQWSEGLFARAFFLLTTIFGAPKDQVLLLWGLMLMSFPEIKVGTIKEERLIAYSLEEVSARLKAIQGNRLVQEIEISDAAMILESFAEYLTSKAAELREKALS